MVKKTSQEEKSYCDLSQSNANYRKLAVTVSNNAVFEVLDVTIRELLSMRKVLYLHIHRSTRRCYIGQAKNSCRVRWQDGNGYKPLHQPKLRAAIDKYGWDAFDSYALAIIENPQLRDQAETEAIKLAGGHRSEHTFNLAPGGRVTVDRSEPLEGYNYTSQSWRSFPSAAYAAEAIGVRSSNNIRRVVVGTSKSAKNWWFRLKGTTTQPPSRWGQGSAIQKTKSVTAVRLSDGKEFQFESISAAAHAIGTHSSNVTAAVKAARGGVRAGHWLKYSASRISLPVLVGRAAGALKNGKPVRATNIVTGEERTFISGRAAAKELGFSEKNVPAALKGRVKTLRGWKLSYLDL